jgi:hypothetical protein
MYAMKSSQYIISTVVLVNIALSLILLFSTVQTKKRHFEIVHDQIINVPSLQHTGQNGTDHGGHVGHELRSTSYCFDSLDRLSSWTTWQINSCLTCTLVLFHMCCQSPRKTGIMH